MTKKAWRIISIVAMVICAACCVYLGAYQYMRMQSHERMDEIAKIGRKTSENEIVYEDIEFVQPMAEKTAEADAEIPIDFAALQEVNPDIYAWVEVPGTAVDYPILQDEEDDSFYLDHNEYKEYTIYGAIYTEKKNGKDFSDPMTLVYGHNMRDGSMFASLHRFEDRDFFDSHDEIIVYTPEHILHYTIYAAYQWNNCHILNTYDFSTEEGFEEYLSDVGASRTMTTFFRDGINVTTDDQLITLSTCIGNHDYRYLVQGVLTETE